MRSRQGPRTSTASVGRAAGSEQARSAVCAFAPWLAACVIVAATGCQSAQPVARAPALTGGGDKPAGTTTPDELQSAVMSFADRFVVAVTDASDRCSEAARSPELTVWMHRNRSATAVAAYIIASGPNPIVSALDMTVFVTLKRILFEEYWAGQFAPGALEPLLKTLRQNEEDIWRITGRFTSEEQRTQLRGLIERWRHDNPDQRYIYSVRFSNFDIYRNRAQEVVGRGPASIFALLYIDPLANMDPTARELTMMRGLVERQSYFAERVPIIIGFQASQFVEDTGATPQVRGALENAAKFAQATDRFAAASEVFAKDLGEQGRALVDRAAGERREALEQAAQIIRTEREAMTADLNATLDRQRGAMVSDLEARNQTVRDLLADMRVTSDRVGELWTSIDRTVQTIDRLAGPGPTGGPESRPFDVRDYGAAADRVGTAAKETAALLESLETALNAQPRAPLDSTLYGAAVSRFDESVSRAVSRFDESVSRAVDLAFGRALILILVSAVAIGGIMLLARRTKKPIA